jgi:hypothetical protein
LEIVEVVNGKMTRERELFLGPCSSVASAIAALAAKCPKIGPRLLKKVNAQ